MEEGLPGFIGAIIGAVIVVGAVILGSILVAVFSLARL